MGAPSRCLPPPSTRSWHGCGPSPGSIAGSTRHWPQRQPSGWSTRPAEHFDGAALTGLAAELGSGSAPGNGAERASALAEAVNVLVPGADVVASGSTVTIEASLLSGSTTATVDLATAPPTVAVGVSGVATGVLESEIDATFAEGRDQGISATFAADLDLGRGAHLTPALNLGADEGRVQAGTLDALGDGTVLLRLAPNGRNPTAAQAEDLTHRLGVPLAVRVALGALGNDVDDALWADGPSLADLLIGARLAVHGGSPPPSVSRRPHGARVCRRASGCPAGTKVELATGLVLGLARDGTRYGVALRGGIALPRAPRPATLHLGLPDDVDPGSGRTPTPGSACCSSTSGRTGTSGWTAASGSTAWGSSSPTPTAPRWSTPPSS